MRHASSLALIVLLLTTGCHRPSVPGPVTTIDHQVSPSAEPGPSTLATPRVSADHARAINQLGFDLYEQLRASKQGNLAISPASISLAFGMTWAGARNETAAEMERVLHFGDLGDEAHARAAELIAWSRRTAGTDADLRVTNRLFGEQSYTFQPGFLTLTRDRYATELEPVDFRSAHEAARQRINAWVDGETEHRIGTILPPGSLNPLVRLVLVNAMTFTGQWASRFDPEATANQAFHRLDGSAPQVPTMHQTGAFRLGRIEGAQVLELPYVGDDLVMTILLPETTDGLPALEARLTAELFDQARASLRQEHEVEVALPRFSIAGGEPVSLKEVMQRLGMVQAFDPEQADFSGMGDPEGLPLYILDAYHNVFVEVDERGTEAAAATAVIMAEECARIVPSFSADHPFLFTINHRETGAAMFLGRVLSPQS